MPSDADVSAMLDRAVEMAWSDTGLPSEERPPTPELVLIRSDEWATSLVRCMNSFGHENYVESGGGLSVGDQGADPQETVDWYLCQATYQVDPREYGAMSSESLDYLYDHYRSQLVPCLEAHGVAIPFVPTREESAHLMADYAGWNPYYAISDTFDPQENAMDRLVYEACPPFPVGEQFDSYREIFEGWNG